MLPKSDEDLINSFLANGDKTLVDDLFKRYRSLVFGVCTKFLDNKADSLDVTMIVFEKILNSRSETKVRNFPNWLFTLTKHCCMDFKNSQLKEEAKRSDLENFKKSENLVVENPDVQRLLSEEDNKIDETDLKNAIQKLDTDQQLCIELFFFKKMRYKEIEEKTGISVKQIKSLLQNGKRKLKRLLLRQKTRNWRNKE